MCLVAALAVCCAAQEGGQPQQAPMDPLEQLKAAAGAIQSRFKQAEKDPNLGKGVDPNLVKEVKSDSEEFWSGIKSLKPEDTAQMNGEDGA